MYKAKLISVEQSENNPDQVKAVVDFYDEGAETVTRTFDWMAIDMNADNFNATIQAVLRQMNADAPALVTTLTSMIGDEITQA
jgi:hypothetical protein